MIIHSSIIRAVHHPWLNGDGDVYRFFDRLLFRSTSFDWVRCRSRRGYELREEMIRDQEELPPPSFPPNDKLTPVDDGVS